MLAEEIIVVGFRGTPLAKTFLCIPMARRPDRPDIRFKVGSGSLDEIDIETFEEYVHDGQTLTELPQEHTISIPEGVHVEHLDCSVGFIHENLLELIVLTATSREGQGLLDLTWDSDTGKLCTPVQLADGTSSVREIDLHVLSKDPPIRYWVGSREADKPMQNRWSEALCGAFDRRIPSVVEKAAEVDSRNGGLTELGFAAQYCAWDDEHFLEASLRILSLEADDKAESLFDLAIAPQLEQKVPWQEFREKLQAYKSTPF